MLGVVGAKMSNSEPPLGRKDSLLLLLGLRLADSLPISLLLELPQPKKTSFSKVMPSSWGGPHLIAHWNAWPLYLNSGQLWQVNPFPELLETSHEAASQPFLPDPASAPSFYRLGSQEPFLIKSLYASLLPRELNLQHHTKEFVFLPSGKTEWLKWRANPSEHICNVT